MNVKAHVLTAPGHPYDGWHPFHGLLDFVKRQIVDEVPEDLAICEFECRRECCSEADWAACELRLRKGAGVLSPGSSAANT